MRHLGTSNIRILLLEKLIPAILHRTLSRVTEEGRAPAGEDAANTLVLEDVAPCLEVARVQFRVDLASGLDEIQWCYTSVGDALHSGVSLGVFFIMRQD